MDTPAAKQWQAKELRVVETTCQINKARFSPSGHWLATADHDGRVRRWDFSGETPVAADGWAGHNGWVTALEWSADSASLIACDSWGGLICHRADDIAAAPRWKQETAHDGWIRALATDLDGGRLATAGNDRAIRLWSAKDGTLLREIKGFVDEVHCLAWHPNGKSLAAGDLHGVVTEWNVETGERVRQIKLEGYHLYERIQDVAGLKTLTFLEDGKTLLTGGGKPTRQGFYGGMPRLDRIDWASGRVEKIWLQENQDKGFIYDLAWHGDGFAIGAINGNLGEGQLLVHRPGDAQPMLLEAKTPNAQSVALHPKGELFVVAATNRGSNANGAVFDKNGKYARNHSPLHVYKLTAAT